MGSSSTVGMEGGTPAATVRAVPCWPSTSRSQWARMVRLEGGKRGGGREERGEGGRQSERGMHAAVLTHASRVMQHQQHFWAVDT